MIQKNNVKSYVKNLMVGNMDNDKDDDLLLPEKQLEIVKKRQEEALSGTIAYLKQQGALDVDIQQARELAEGFDPNNVESFDDSLIYRAYYAAKKCKTASLRNLARALNMTPQLLKFYCEQYPKLGMAIQAGYMDAVDIMKESLVDKLYEAAMGTSVTNVSTTRNYIVNEDGVKIPTNVTEVEHEVSIAPNVSAQLELLKRLDPAWIPKVGVDVKAEINHNLNVTQDVNVQVDYRKLSVEALKELLEAGRDDTREQLNKSEAVPNLINKAHERIREERDLEKQEKNVASNAPKKRGRPRNILRAHEQTINEVKNQLKAEDKQNGSKTSNRGRKKKDS